MTAIDDLLRGRDALYTHITESLFRDSFAQHFTTTHEETLANGRIMLHLLKK